MKDELYLYEYKVKFYDEDEKKNLNSKGIVAGTTYCDVMEKLSPYYGDDNIIDISIKLIDNTVSGILEQTAEEDKSV